jgi:hypothetical protein
MNNVVKYNAFLIALNLSFDRNKKHLNVIGYFHVVISQVNLKFFAKNERLRKYMDSARDNIKLFNDFSTVATPKEKNYVTDALVISASTLQPCEEVLQELIQNGSCL